MRGRGRRGRPSGSSSLRAVDSSRRVSTRGKGRLFSSGRPRGRPPLRYSSPSYHDENSRSGTPNSRSEFGGSFHDGSGSRSLRQRRGRPAAERGRHFIKSFKHVIKTYEDEVYPESDIEEHSDSDSSGSREQIDSTVSDFEYSLDSEPESELSESGSVCTIGSSTSSQRKIPYLAEQFRPWIDIDQSTLPHLILPKSSEDLLVTSDCLLDIVSIYETLRRFRTIVRLSPFRFEDFCAAMATDEANILLAEIHVQILKALWREEDGSNTTFGPPDLRDSIGVSLYFVDGITWPELVKRYLDSDSEFRVALNGIDTANYPFVPVSQKVQVLQALCDLFLASNTVREELMSEGNIKYDDHCRACHKLGDLLCCETCPAVYHLACVDPPMEEVPEDEWLCSVCVAHQVSLASFINVLAFQTFIFNKKEHFMYFL